MDKDNIQKYVDQNQVRLNQSQANLSENQQNLILIEKELDENGGGGNGVYTPIPLDPVLMNSPSWSRYSIGAMGLIPWGAVNIKRDPYGVEKAVDNLFFRVKKTGAKNLEGFLMNGSLKLSELYIHKGIPWKWVIRNGKKEVDFGSRNKAWWDMAGLVEKYAKRWKIYHNPITFMDRYNYDMFDSVGGFWGPDAETIMTKFIREYTLFQKGYWSPNYNNRVILINEPAHNKNHKLGLIIARRHLAMYRAIQDLVKFKHIKVVSTLSEYAHAELVEWHWDPWNKLYLGSEEFSSRVRSEKHGVSTLATLIEDGFAKPGTGVGSGWRHFSYNGDGGSWDGKFVPIPDGAWRQGDKAQLSEMLHFGITETMARGKRFDFVAFLIGCLVNVNGVLQENFYDLDRPGFGWDNRLLAWKEVCTNLGI